MPSYPVTHMYHIGEAFDFVEGTTTHILHTYGYNKMWMPVECVWHLVGERYRSLEAFPASSECIQYSSSIDKNFNCF